MYINGANNYPAQLPAFTQGNMFSMPANGMAKFAQPGPKMSFADGGITNLSGGFLGGGFPGMNAGFMGGSKLGGLPAMGGFQSLGGLPMLGGLPNMFGLPNMGNIRNMGGLPNMGSFMNMGGLPKMGGIPQFGGKLESMGEVEGVQKEPRKSLSGKGSIDGTNFKSADGERYELKVESGKSYNLLSDVGVGLNGTYGTVAGETVLTDIALSVGGKIITLANDGTLRVDGKPFDKKKNNLEGLVTENKNGTYTVKANGYEFDLKASDHGIRVGITATNARTPEGLWGVALDGEKNTEAELQKAIKESDYKIDNALTFDYQDNNNIGEKYIADLDEDELNELAWNARNPQLPAAGWNLRMGMNNSWLGGVNKFIMHGPSGSEDDSEWIMDKLQPNKFYNVFSDEGIQVNGKFANGVPQELGFIVDGENVRVERSGNGLKVTVNGDVVTSYNNCGINYDGTTLKIISEGDEAWEFHIRGSGNGIDFFGESKNAGANSTRSTGLLGDTIRQNMADIDGNNVSDLNGAGYLRNVDGSLTKAGQDMSKALREYIVDSWDDTSSGRSVYE